jgi:transposase
VIKLGELVMILELHRQGLSVSAIARQLGIDRKTVRVHIAKGLEAPSYKTRPPRPRLIDSAPYLRERIAAFPTLTGRVLKRTALLTCSREVARPDFALRRRKPRPAGPADTLLSNSSGTYTIKAMRVVISLISLT